MKKITLFTPCYNEEDNLPILYKKVCNIMANLPEYNYEYILIDNCSQDKTADIMRELAAKDKRVKVILNNRNFGPNPSGCYGFFQGTGDAFICFAADFQEPPELIPEFIRKWEAGYKVVWGHRAASEERGLLHSARTLYYKIIKNFADYPQYENVTGFGLYDKEVMDRLKKTNDPEPNLRNLIGYFGYEVAFVDFIQPLRKHGKSSYNFIRYVNFAIHAFITTSTAPLKMCSTFGFFLSILCFIVGMFYFFMKLIYWDSIRIGTAPLLLGMFFLGGVQLTFIGIIGQYIAEILHRQMNRPLVVEKERINFDK